MNSASAESSLTDMLRVQIGRSESRGRIERVWVLNSLQSIQR